MHMGIDPHVRSCNGNGNEYKCETPLVLWTHAEELGIDVEKDGDMYGIILCEFIVILPWIWILR